MTRLPPNPSSSRAALRGMSLIEMMVALTFFGVVILGLVYTQMFGALQDQILLSKSSACEMARLGLNSLVNDIRGAKMWQIGSGSATTFSPAAQGAAQQGNALKLSLSMDTNQYIVYYFDTNALKLLRRHSGSTSNTTLAQSLTNSMYFVAETYRGATQYNLSYKGVIRTSLQFAQYAYPLQRVGTNYYYNSYGLDLRVTPHVPDGI